MGSANDSNTRTYVGPTNYIYDKQLVDTAAFYSDNEVGLGIIGNYHTKDSIRSKRFGEYNASAKCVLSQILCKIIKLNP